MFCIAYKGLIIGIVVSTLIGPVGLLCIQQTICSGRWYGFFSGVGASFSDFLYATIACTSMRVVDGFIEKNKINLQFFESIILIIFGAYIFFKKPYKNINLASLVKKRINSYTQNILTVFLLSLSNPFIIFLYVSLFDRFNIFLERNTKICVLLLFIFIGNLLWWFVITFLVSKFRKVFSIKRLYFINKGIGIIVIFLAIFELFNCFI
ncbi:MAG: LysE family translocator [Bacteroidales bacterium OttesenSCG-928-I14]|jgi:threonine/homoserine/homoserine lactone efflux protein|nr:LysE family translocator [Bacteroidales bacterium OttesenSCG-928-I14]